MTTHPIHYSSRRDNEVGQMPELVGRRPGFRHWIGPIVYSCALLAIVLPQTGFLGAVAGAFGGIGLFCLIQAITNSVQRRKCRRLYPTEGHCMCEFVAARSSKDSISFGYLRIDSRRLSWDRARGAPMPNRIQADLSEMTSLIVLRYGLFSTHIWLKDESASWTRLKLPARFTAVLRMFDSFPGLLRIDAPSASRRSGGTHGSDRSGMMPD